MENRIIDLLKKLKNKKTYEDLFPVGSSPGILYGRAKIHKPVKHGVPSLHLHINYLNFLYHY